MADRKPAGPAATATTTLWIGLAASLLACGSDGGADASPLATPTPRPVATPSPVSTGIATPTPAAPEATPTPVLTPGEPLAMRLTEVATGLDRPLFLTWAQGEPQRLYVLEQPGRVRVIDGGRLLPEPFLDLSDRVSCCGERGLLGLAFAPDYATSGRLFVNYTDSAGDTVIAEYRRSGAAGASPNVTETRVLLHIDQPFPNHNGGMLAFGPDGLLYVGMGDGGSAGDPQGNGQRLDTKLGKILRLDVDRHPVPPTGNFPGADPDAWAIGARNPWRFSFDRATGDLWIGDVGQNRFEEIDVARHGQSALNFGWNVLEGDACFRAEAACDAAGTVRPVAIYGRDSGCSVTGGVVHRGSVPGLAGRYLFADYCSGRVWSLDAARSAPLPGGAADLREHTADLEPARGLGALTSFGEDAAGETYLVSQDGRIWRIDGAAD